MASPRPRVVIVGAGFAGLWAARSLAHRPVDVLLVDRQNYHTFLPLLYQVAAAELEPEEIAYPVRSIFRGKPNLRFALADIAALDLPRRSLQAGDVEIPYDYLILGAGSTSHFFGVPGSSENAYRLKSLDDGVRLRNHILQCFERSVRSDEASRQRMLTFTIIGGGPTGIEFAGALAELVHGPLRRDYPELRAGEGRILLLEALDRLLPTFPPKAGEYAQWRLHRMQVEVLLQARVRQVDPAQLTLADGTVLPSETVVWTAGVLGSPLAQTSAGPLRPSGDVAVLPTLQWPGHPEVYVAGDLAYLEQDGHLLPKVAPVAIQEGTAAAQNILRQVSGEPLRPFRFHDRGMMVTIGRNAAVATLAGHTFTGILAWLIWLSVHIFNLIGFRNRLLVLINWALDYFFLERAVRLILPGVAPGVVRSSRDLPPAKTV